MGFIVFGSFVIFLVGVVGYRFFWSDRPAKKLLLYNQKLAHLTFQASKGNQALITTQLATLELNGALFKVSPEFKTRTVSHKIHIDIQWPQWFFCFAHDGDLTLKINDQPIELGSIISVKYPSLITLQRIQQSFLFQLKAKYPHLDPQLQLNWVLDHNETLADFSHVEYGTPTLMAPFSAVLLNSMSEAFNTVRRDLPDEAWMFWLSVYQDNLPTHIIRAIALDRLLKTEPQLPEVQALWQHAVEEMPAPLFARLLSMDEDRAVSLLFDVQWSTRRWLDVTRLLVTQNLAAPSAQNISIRRCIESIGYDGLELLTREDGEVILPILMHIHDHEPVHRPLISTLSLKWLPWMSVASCIAWLEIHRTIDHFEQVAQRAMNTEQRKRMGAILAVCICRQPNRVAEERWATQVIAFIDVIPPNDVQDVGSAMVDHLLVRFVGPLQAALENNQVARSPLGGYLQRNFPSLTQRAKNTAHHGGLSLSSDHTQAGGLSVATQGGDLSTISDEANK